MKLTEESQKSGFFLVFFSENSEFSEFIVIEDETWSQDKCGVIQIQEQSDCRQIVVEIYSNVPSDIPNPAVVVLREQPEEHIVLSGTHVLPKWCFHCHCPREGSGTAVPKPLRTSHLCSYFN